MSRPTETPASASIYLITAVFCACVAYYLNYRWKRRHLFQLMSKIPGPPGLPFLGNAMSFLGSTHDIFLLLESWELKYKPPLKVWIGSLPLVVFIRPSDISKLLNSPHAINKSPILVKFSETFLGDGLLFSDAKKWKSRRKLIATTFVPKILESFVPIFNEQSNILVKCLEKHVGEEAFDIWHYLSRASLDSLCRTMMGVELNSQTKDSEYLKAASGVLQTYFLRLAKIWYHMDWLFYRLPIGITYVKNIRTMHELCTNIIAEKKQYFQSTKSQKTPEENVYGTNPNRRAFLELLIEITAGDPTFSERDLKDEVDTMMIAGFETTATTNSFVMLALAMYPDVQQKAYEEIREIFGDSDRPVEVDDLVKLKYLEMVIKETLRIYPTVVMFTRNVEKDIEFEDFVVPEGASAVVWLKSVHNDPTVWPEPQKFDPYRFTAEEVAKRHPLSYLPFGSGVRNCIGFRYAMLSMKTLIVTILRSYEISTHMRSEDIKLEFNTTLQSANGYVVKLNKRCPA